MNKWYISDQGNISEPLTFGQAKELAQKNNTSYAWTSYFTHWLPVHLIPEFEINSDINVAANSQIIEIQEKVKIRKQRIDNRYRVIEQKIVENQSLISTLEDEISTYQQLSKNLSSNVQDIILPIKKSLDFIKEKQAMLAQSVSISANEIQQIMDKFSAKQNTVLKDSVSTIGTEEKLSTQHSNVMQSDFHSKANSQSESPLSHDEKVADLSNYLPEKTLVEDTEHTTLTSKPESKSGSEPNSMVKGLLKSVFKQETKEQASEPLLSELIQEQEDKALCEVVNGDINADEPAKKRRRRRRR